ncbi:hypothetical protein G4B88_017334 [Cannabis sativa]|uniref:CCHC-type domain-containing protein n=1 Tax=Cannabis sativa TaxID=3483 RepID=A0A7J6EFE5_CANSA|nr:hypothetical protein G4B88_017334 [Cannabis sativa]
MELVTTDNASRLGKSFTCAEASITLSQCANSLKALSSLCLFGKVVAPMNVDTEAIIEFVTKNWLKPVAVCSLSEAPDVYNCFKLSFECVEDKEWALVKSPWSFRGYSFILYAWFPGIERSCSVNVLRVWVQVHNLPHEFFSTANGNRLGGMIGKVVSVELDEAKPVTWGCFFRILVDLNFHNPLVSGCYFDLTSGEKRWLQFKFEKIGIFCYNCGRLGHQRRGCSLASPVTVEAVDGSLHPLFGPWMSTESRFKDVFSSVPKPVVTCSVVAQASPAVCEQKVTAVGQGGPVGSALPKGAGGQNRWKKTTGRVFPGHKQAVNQKWVPKGGSGERASIFAVKGKEVRVNLNYEGKKPVALPCLEPSTVMKKSIYPLDNVGSCTGLDVLGGGLSKVKKGLGRLDIGPSKDVPKCPGPGKSFIEKIGDIDVIMGGPGRDDNWAVAPINLVEPNLEKDLINKEGGEVNSGPCGNEFATGEGSTAQVASPCGAELYGDEDKAFAHFLKAQEELLYDLKHFGKLDLYEIKKIGGDIGVKPTSETNERTTPFMKRKFEGSASLCTRPNKIVRRNLEVVRDFPWDIRERDLESKVEFDDLSEEPSEESSSPSCNNASFLVQTATG